MNPREFGIFASRLVSAEKLGPAEVRTAVSRAYYAVFNGAVALLKKFGVETPKSWEGHKSITTALRNCKDLEILRACQDLDDLRAMRWAADYDMQDDVIEDHRLARKWCARAKQAIKKLDECEADQTRFQDVRMKIRIWAGSADGAAKGFSLV